MGNMLPNSDTNTTSYEDDGTNGFCLKGHYLPEDVLIVLLSHVDTKHLLKCKLVCKLWDNIIKSKPLWNEICTRNGVKFKGLPWYLYYMKFATDFFDTNMIKNGNGQDKFDHWVIKPVFSGDGFLIESEPNGCLPLPLDVEDFCGHKSCYATSFAQCSKQQILRFKNNKIKKHILDTYKPTILASEWIAPRFDCSSRYELFVRIAQCNKKFKSYNKRCVLEQWTEGIWEKVEIEVKDYPGDVDYIVFQHEGQDQLFWKGHYGVKMAGASLKVLFDSINESDVVQD